MKERLDILLVDRRLVESRSKAQWLIRNGYVLVNDVEIRRSGKKINDFDEIKLKQKFPYVGKGGLKLEAALKSFSIDVKNKICVDIGASIGGFTDCLLKHGALKVYAVDTAMDLLHPSLRCEKMKNKVIPLLGIDARELKELKEKADICTIDLTFASLKSILPNVPNYLNKEGVIISLVKPLFETEFYNLSRYKIITNPEKLFQILKDLIDWSVKKKIYPYGIIKSPLLGEKGRSIEFLIYFRIDNKNSNFFYEDAIKNVLN